MSATTTSDPGSFMIVTMIATAPVTMAPKALMASRWRYPGGLLRNQWRTMPDWLMVKSMNTPTA